MAKGKRGIKFTTGELEALVEAVEELVLISTTVWEWVWDQHISRYPDQQRYWKGKKSKQVIRICRITSVLQNKHTMQLG